MIGLAALMAAAALLAYANGANDISKGIATLVGSGTTTDRRAILWGTAWTAVGAALAMAVAGAMLATFGQGLLGSGVTATFAASAAAIGGAAAWVLVATRTGLPVSTTHAIVGATVGAALSAYGAGGIAWPALVTKVAIPLAASPIVAVGLALVVAQAIARWPAPPAGAADCLCVASSSMPVVSLASGGTMAFRTQASAGLRITSGDTQSCEPRQSLTLRLTGDHLHWLSSASVCFARGLNDAPKIAALTLGAAALAPAAVFSSPVVAYALVTVAMVTGSLLGGRRVTHLLAERVTPLTHRDGLAANIVAAVLVTSGAVYGLPMSTTHVASGGIIGIGADRGSLDWSTVRAMALAWLVTVPAAALLGAVLFFASQAVWP